MCGHGICTDSPHGPVCNCTDDTYGPRCQHNGSNPCTSYTCGNGLCSSVNAVDYECLCDAGFTGENCEQDVNDCQSDPCFNHGICHDLINSYECDCNGTGYNGPQCNMDIDEC
uniref:EGF-like domain-containing protein n=1 Tax=Ciona savignyi TaxID=51511 RepID=H2YSX9_CIOSA